MAEPEAVRNEYRRKLLQHKELDSKLRTCESFISKGKWRISVLRAIFFELPKTYSGIQFA